MSWTSISDRAAAVRELLRHATRAEAPVVESLALAAGMLWRCRLCVQVNDDGQDYCPRCGGKRKP